MNGDVFVVGVNGSPRKYGASFKLLRIALHFSEKAGAETETIHLYDYDIKPCFGCVSDGLKYCRFPCIVQDDFNTIAEKLLRADAVIFSTPIYWYQVSGVMKNFIDRLTSFENMIYHEPRRSLFEGKIAAFIAVGNDTGAITTISWMMSVLNSMGAHIPAWALAYHHDREKDVLENKDAVRDAANLGRIVVEAARLLRRQKEWYREIPDDELVEAVEKARHEAVEWEERQLKKRLERMLQTSRS